MSPTRIGIFPDKTVIFLNMAAIGGRYPPKTPCQEPQLLHPGSFIYPGSFI